MDTKFKVEGEDGQYYGTFDKLNDAKEQAHEMANVYEKDIFILKITTELLECVIPD